MTRDAISALFERRQAAFAAHDSVGLAADYTEDCVIESPTGGVHHGRAAAERVLRTVFDALDVKLHQDSIIIDGDNVATVLQIEGTDGGQFLGLPPTGKSFKVPGVFLYKLRDGKISQERRIYDFTGMMVQMGLLKTKPV
jgi:steroid delta-isomerase-like uncharacterized protein